jgi:hypothetical protein
MDKPKVDKPMDKLKQTPSYICFACFIDFYLIFSCPVLFICFLCVIDDVFVVEFKRMNCENVLIVLLLSRYK